MVAFVPPCVSRTAVLVLAVLINVHPSPSPALEGRGSSVAAVSGRAAKTPTSPVARLPGPVEEMREAILAATRSGQIEDLRVPLEWNELTPDVAPAKVDDPIAYWKKISADGEGREILAALANILQMRPVELPLGKDLENNLVYVWPYLAGAKLDQLTPAEEVDLLRLVTPEEAKAMRKAGKWTWWRLAIGADGTWHSFRRPD
jgi:hypothetical protein